MKVLHVHNGLGTGGAERSLAELLPRFRAAGIQSTIALLYRRTEGVQDHVAAGYDVRYLRSRHLPTRVRELRSILRAVQPDVVHTTIHEADIVGRLAAAGTGVPLLSSLVGTPYDEARRADPNVRRWRLEAARALEGWTARRFTDRFHAISHAVADAAVRDLGVDRSRITVIERGRDAERLGAPSAARRQAARAGLGLGDGDEVVAHVGRQEYPKDPMTLVRAVALLRRRNRHVVLLQAGRRGAASPELDRVLAEVGDASFVRLLGHRDDVPEILAAADVFAFPSRHEGLGGALIEAMALALPIVASDLPAVREVVTNGRNADLVAAGDAEAFADAIGYLLEDADRRSVYAAASRERFLDRFTLERSAPLMVELLERTAART